MASRAVPVRQTCCCFNVRVATTALAIYHIVMSVLLFTEHMVEVARGKVSCRFSKMPYLRIADLLSSFLLIGVLFAISISLLFGVVKNREKYLMPFLSLQIMDFLLCLLTLLGFYIELPAYLKLGRPRPGSSKVPLMTLKLLDFCLSVLTLCSSYMEVPAYLNFKSMNHMNYLPSQEGMPYNQFINMMIIFSVAFVTVLILKVYMFKCVWTCYKFMKHMNSAVESSNSKMFLKVALPSHEEALSMPTKTPEGGPCATPVLRSVTPPGLSPRGQESWSFFLLLLHFGVFCGYFRTICLCTPSLSSPPGDPLTHNRVTPGLNDPLNSEYSS